MRTRSSACGARVGALLFIIAAACTTADSTANPANSSTPSRPSRLTNGATLSALSSHWVCVEGCTEGSYVDYIGSEVRLALATDGGFRSKITWRYAAYTYVSTCSGSWMASGNGESAIVATTACTGTLSYPNDPAIGGHASVTSLMHIAGSTANAAFSADVNSDDYVVSASGLVIARYNGPRNRAACRFNLASGSL